MRTHLLCVELLAESYEPLLADGRGDLPRAPPHDAHPHPLLLARHRLRALPGRVPTLFRP